jgi:VWFA-related protein
MALTALAVVATSSSFHAQEPSLATVMARVGSYAATFQRQLSNIVAEERYVQDITHMNLAPGRFAADAHRELLSDVLLVQPAGTNRYVGFRDVFAVNGTPIRDRQNRLAALFLSPDASAEAQIERINRESARYNIGNIERTINTPTLPLLFLLAPNQTRFRFTRGLSRGPAINRSIATPRGAEAASFAVPADVWTIDYEEVERPTMIRTTFGADLPAHGRFWADPETGRVLMTELVTDDPAVRATIDVSYQRDLVVEVHVPAEMRERYEGRRDGAVIEGNAIYGKIRQFQVRADERLAGAEPPLVETATATPAAPADSPVLEPVASDVDLKTIGTSVEVQPPTTPAAAQDAPKPPTFATRTELVLVDFVVNDSAGRPVRGLSAKDFVLKEDGTECPIVTFEAFGGNAPVASADAGTVPGTSSHATPSTPAAVTVLLVDDGHLSQAQAARLRPALKGLLTTVGERGGALMLLAPASKVQIVGTLPGGTTALTAAVDRIAGQRVDDASNFPVADSEALAIARGDNPALARLVARFMALNPELNTDQANMFVRERANLLAHDARARRDDMYDVALRSLDWLAGRPGRHGLIVISSGFAADPDDSKYTEVVTRSLRANAPIHFLDARGLQGMSRYQGVDYGTALGRGADEGPFGWSDGAAGSTALADDTGGLIVSNTNDMAKRLGHLLDSMTTYYLVAYQPPSHQKPGYRKIRVEVKTRGLQVRARRGYFSEAPIAR